jgi:succinyl-diaminopimelate desuccinylase
VPAGEGWTVTEPFKPVVKDGRIYGRGTSDDKGPLLCALYAMRAIKECGIPLKKGVRLIMGSDEETGSTDIEKYYAEEPEAEMTFSPDAEFPLINIEKGQFRGEIEKSFAESKTTPRLVSIEAGVAVNAVPQKAVIRLEGFDMNLAEAPMDDIAKECGVTCQQTGMNEITVIGESAHASTPEFGKNAGIAALMLAAKLPLPECEQLRAIKNVLKLFPYGVTDGSGLGIKMCDEESHDLTCTLDMFHVTTTEIDVMFDSRTPLMATKENCEDIARKSIESLDLEFVSKGMVPPHAVPSDSEFVQKLLKAYETVTGLKGEAIAIGGGTYVHELKNGVAFGAILPGIDTRMHGADEFFDLDNILIATKVYAEAIIELCS